MEYLWSTYGVPMEQHARNTLATRSQHATNTLAAGGRYARRGGLLGLPEGSKRLPKLLGISREE